MGGWRFFNGGRMEKKKNETVTVRKKTRFVVIREFTGSRTMEEAFAQLVERMAYEQFEKEKAKKAG